ncbi:phage holin family protein [Candidatus Uhrbacteria bacterium]|nr:phage holin family protein [Candidatus Uhrbacteria bacterium]
MLLLLRWVISAASVMVAAYLVPGVSVRSFWAAFIAALIIGLVNALIRPLVLLLTLPVNIITLGLFTFVVNAFMFWLASSIVKGFDVMDFRAAFFGALVYWLTSWLVNGLFDTKDKKRLH